jgi:mannosylglycoprotein endo-beta-mannosidase
LKLFKQYFKGWSFNLQGELRKKRVQISEKLTKIESYEETSFLGFHQLARKVYLIKEYLQLLDQEETYWVNRCHENWLLKGDNNTSYFHKIANGRKRKNNVVSLENNGELIEGDENLLKHATDYYKELFGLEEDHNIHIDHAL